MATGSLDNFFENIPRTKSQPHSGLPVSATAYYVTGVLLCLWDNVFKAAGQHLSHGEHPVWQLVFVLKFEESSRKCTLFRAHLSLSL